MKIQALWITVIFIGVLSNGINGQNMWFGPMSIPFRPWELKEFERTKQNNPNPWRPVNSQVKSTGGHEPKGNRPPHENKQSNDINFPQHAGVNGIHQPKTDGWSSEDIQKKDNNYPKVELHKKPFGENNVGVRLEVNPESKQFSTGGGLSTPEILLTGWKSLQDGITMTAHDLTLSDLSKLQGSGILTTPDMTHSAWNQQNNRGWSEDQNKQRGDGNWKTDGNQRPNGAGWRPDGAPQRNKENWEASINHKYADGGWAGENNQGVNDDTQTRGVNLQNNQEGWISEEHKQPFDNRWVPEVKKQVTDASWMPEEQMKRNADEWTSGVNQQNTKEGWSQEGNKQTSDDRSILDKNHLNSDGRWTSEQDKQAFDSRWIPDEQKKYNPESWAVGVSQRKTEEGSIPDEQIRINDNGWTIKENHETSNHPQGWTPEHNHNQNQPNWNDGNQKQNDWNMNKDQGHRIDQERTEVGNFDINQPQSWTIPNEFPNGNNWNAGNTPSQDNNNWKNEENGNQDWNEGNKQHANDGWTANPINQDKDQSPFVGTTKFDVTRQTNEESWDNNNSELPYPNTAPDIPWKSNNRDAIIPQVTPGENNKPDGNFPGDYRKDTAEFGSNASPPTSTETRVQWPTKDDARDEFNFASAIGPPREDENRFDGVSQRGDTASTSPPYPTRIPQGNYKGGDGTYPDDGHAEPSYENTIPGTAGVDYPNNAFIPETGFQCGNQNYPGYFADIETGCQVYHVCQSDGRHNSFLCPTGTVFNQKLLTCDWWYHYDCQDAAEHYPLNQVLFREVDNYKGTRYPGSRTNALPSIPQDVNLRAAGEVIPNSQYDDTRYEHPISTGDSRNFEGEFHGSRGETLGMMDIPPPAAPVHNSQKDNVRYNLPGQIDLDGGAKNFQGGFQEAAGFDEPPVTQSDLPYYERPEIAGGVTQEGDRNINNFPQGGTQNFDRDGHHKPWNQNNGWTKNDQQQTNEDNNPNFYSQVRTNEDNRWISNTANNPAPVHDGGWDGNINGQDTYVQHKVSGSNNDHNVWKAEEGHQIPQNRIWSTRRNDDALWDKDIQDKWKSQVTEEEQRFSQKDTPSLANPGISQAAMLYDQNHEGNNRETDFNLNDGSHTNFNNVQVFISKQDRNLDITQEKGNVQPEVNNVMPESNDPYPFDPIFIEQSRYSDASKKKFIPDKITASEGSVNKNQDVKDEYLLDAGRIVQKETTARDILASEGNIGQNKELGRHYESETPYSKIDINITNAADGSNMGSFHSETDMNSAFKRPEDDYNAQESKTFHVSAIAPEVLTSDHGSTQIVTREGNESLKVGMMYQNKSADKMFKEDSDEQVSQQQKTPTDAFNHFAATYENSRKIEGTHEVESIDGPISTDSDAFTQRKMQNERFFPRNGEFLVIRNYTVRDNINSTDKIITEKHGDRKSEILNLAGEITAHSLVERNSEFEGSDKISSSYKNMKGKSVREGNEMLHVEELRSKDLSSVFSEDAKLDANYEKDPGVSKRGEPQKIHLLREADYFTSLSTLKDGGKKNKENASKKLESISGSARQHLKSNVNLSFIARPKYVNKNSYRRFQEHREKDTNKTEGEKSRDFDAIRRRTPVILRNGAWKKRIIIINKNIPDYDSTRVANGLRLKQDNVSQKMNFTIDSIDKHKYLLNPAGRNKSINNPNFTRSNLYKFPFNYNAGSISKYRSKSDAKEEKKGNSIYFESGQNTDVNERHNLKEFNIETNGSNKVQRFPNTRNTLKTGTDMARNGRSRDEMKETSDANRNNANLPSTFHLQPSEGIKEQSYPWEAANTTNRWRINVYKRRKNDASAETLINNRNDNRGRTLK